MTPTLSGLTLDQLAHRYEWYRGRGLVTEAEHVAGEVNRRGFVLTSFDRGQTFFAANRPNQGA